MFLRCPETLISSYVSVNTTVICNSQNAGASPDVLAVNRIQLHTESSNMELTNLTDFCPFSCFCPVSPEEVPQIVSLNGGFVTADF